MIKMNSHSVVFGQLVQNVGFHKNSLNPIPPGGGINLIPTPTLISSQFQTIEDNPSIS